MRAIKPGDCGGAMTPLRGNSRQNGAEARRAAEKPPRISYMLVSKETHAMLRDHPLTDESSIDPASLILNILWLALGGAMAALGWFVAALIMVVTIIGIPWAGAAFDNGVYTLWPFGAKTVNAERVYGDGGLGAGPLGFLGNIIWFVFAGWWLALGHLVAALLLAITIIGLPFAWAHFKLAGFALWPIGRSVVRHDYGRRY